MASSVWSLVSKCSCFVLRFSAHTPYVLLFLPSAALFHYGRRDACSLNPRELRLHRGAWRRFLLSSLSMFFVHRKSLCAFRYFGYNMPVHTSFDVREEWVFTRSNMQCQFKSAMRQVKLIVTFAVMDLRTRCGPCKSAR